ncbi:MAG: 50S ribosomal protein L1 [Verrucomicrobia bacterium]|nr:50S ribosomal protein L1 [Verrucomicrobiota bacterium]
MAKKRSKRYMEAAKLVDSTKAYPLDEAVKVVKKFPSPKFDQTVTVSVRLGVDPKQSDQMVRGTCSLPHGSGKDVRVAVFAEGEAAEAARKAGAEFVGMDDLIKRVRDENFLDFDVAVATPAAMTELRKLGRVLGPRGLMPNPKTGTVTDDTARAVLEVKAGRVDFKLDKNANVSMTVGKASFTPEQLAENTRAAVDAVQGAKPASARGVYIRSITIAGTMSPGVSVDAAPLMRTVG